MLNRAETYLLVALTHYKDHQDIWDWQDDVLNGVKSLYDWRIKRAEEVSDKKAEWLETEKKEVLDVITKFFETPNPRKRISEKMDRVVDDVFRYLLDVKAIALPSIS